MGVSDKIKVDRIGLHKTIASFMGNSDAIPVNIEELSERQKKIYLPYSHSLDALIPVWEKIGRIKGHCGIGLHFSDNFGFPYECIEDAAAVCTVVMIEELNNGVATEDSGCGLPWKN